MVGQDVMQPAEVSLKKGSLNDFSQFLLLWLMPPHFRFFYAAPSSGRGRDGRASGGGDLSAGGCHNGKGSRCPGRGDGLGERCVAGNHP
jgi:hypothetical protein